MRPKLSSDISHHGQTSERRQIGGIIFIESIYAPNIKFPKHSHRNACFTLIHQGGYIESFGKTILTVKPNSVIFRPPETAHSDKFGSSQVRCSLIEIDSELFDRLSQDAAIINDPVGFDSDQIVWQAMRLCHEFHQLDDVAPLAIEGLTLEMLAKATRTVRSISRTPPKWLMQVREFLNDQLSENLTLN